MLLMLLLLVFFFLSKYIADRAAQFVEAKVNINDLNNGCKHRHGFAWCWTFFPLQRL